MDGFPRNPASRVYNLAHRTVAIPTDAPSDPAFADPARTRPMTRSKYFEHFLRLLPFCNCTWKKRDRGGFAYGRKQCWGMHEEKESATVYVHE